MAAHYYVWVAIITCKQFYLSLYWVYIEKNE